MKIFLDLSEQHPQSEKKWMTLITVRCCKSVKKVTFTTMLHKKYKFIVYLKAFFWFKTDCFHGNEC